MKGRGSQPRGGNAASNLRIVPRVRRPAASIRKPADGVQDHEGPRFGQPVVSSDRARRHLVPRASSVVPVVVIGPPSTGIAHVLGTAVGRWGGTVPPHPRSYARLLRRYRQRSGIGVLVVAGRRRRLKVGVALRG